MRLTNKIKIMAVAAAVVTGMTSISAMSYSDVKESDWFYDNITEMSEKGLMTGYEDGSFRPSGQITYAELITILKRTVTGSAEKSDSGHWAKENVSYAYEHGWYDYDEINEQTYDKPVPRYMAVKLTALSLDIPKTENDEGVYWHYMNEIKDFNSINGRYAYMVVRAYNDGVLKGDESGNFNPDSTLTRAEACAMVSRAAGLVDTKSATEAIQTTEPIAVHKGGASENGKLHVSGTQLCNERGEAVELHGMSTHGLQWFGEYTSREYIRMCADSGANLFRAAMYTAENGYISQPEEMKKRLYAAVDNAISEDMYVIIDWHILADGNPQIYANEAAEFFGEVSLHYGVVPNVIYEICNEPNGQVSWSGDVKPYAERIIPVIRSNAPDSIILVGSPTWSQDIDKAADDPLAFENIMYTCHFYAGTHGQWLRDRITYAISKGAPIFISEWGTSAADGSGGVYPDETRKWIEFMDSNNLSWANWSLCNKQESSAALNQDGSLSQSGQLVFESF